MRSAYFHFCMTVANVVMQIVFAVEAYRDGWRWALLGNAVLVGLGIACVVLAIRLIRKEARQLLIDL